jgi:hypothetical protein
MLGQLDFILACISYRSTTYINVPKIHFSYICSVIGFLIPTLAQYSRLGSLSI